MQYGYHWKDEQFFLATWFWILYILTAFYFTINVSYPWWNLPMEVIYPKLVLSSSPSEYCYHILGHHRFEPLFFLKSCPTFDEQSFPLSMLILGQKSCFLRTHHLWNSTTELTSIATRLFFLIVSILDLGMCKIQERWIKKSYYWKETKERFERRYTTPTL